LKISINSPCSASTIIKYGIKNWPIWECKPSNFPWSYEEKETCLIIEGEAKIKTSSEIYDIKSGDLVIFPAGLNCNWEVSKAIKKHYRIGD
tara:strand:+ start:361 stop:633 length:273 start_codon:yes stop_codon:yes gene_type:complete